MRWWKTRHRQHGFAGVVSLDMSVDPADHLARRELVLIGKGGTPKWLKFACPCRCGEVIALNLMGSYSPRWSVQQDSAGSISVSPSVDSTTCGAHFFIRRNRVEWC